MRAVAEVTVPSVFSLLPAHLHDKEGRPFTVRALTPRDRWALEEFYDAFDPKRAAQGLPPAGQARSRPWWRAFEPPSAWTNGATPPRSDSARVRS